MTQDPQSARMPEEIYAGYEGNNCVNKTSRWSKRDIWDDGAKYIRSDLTLPKDKLQGWIEAMEHSRDYVRRTMGNPMRMPNDLLDKLDKKIAEMREMVKVDNV
jgi:hypothetical protein